MITLSSLLTGLILLRRWKPGKWSCRCLSLSRLFHQCCWTLSWPLAPDRACDHVEGGVPRWARVVAPLPVHRFIISSNDILTSDPLQFWNFPHLWRSVWVANCSGQGFQHQRSQSGIIYQEIRHVGGSGSFLQWTYYKLWEFLESIGQTGAEWWGT